MHQECENGRLNREIENLRTRLNRQKDIRELSTLELSLKLDQLILEAMKHQPVKK